MNVRRGSNPHAMMSFAFSRARRLASLSSSDFHRNFSSSPLGEVERDQVPEMQRLGRRPSPRVQVELLAALVRGDDLIELAVREEHPAAQERVRARVRDALDALHERGVDGLAAELIDELGVIDLPVRAAGDVPRGDDLLATVFRGGGRGGVRVVARGDVHGGDAGGDGVHGGGHRARFARPRDG
eukprot:31362-Pelagococcus_subviridis.AAC.7